MEGTLTGSFMEVRSSRGIVRNFQFSTPIIGLNGVIAEPVNDFRLLDRMVRNDEIICAAFDATVEMVSRNGYDFFPLKGTDSAEKEKESAYKKFNELKFPEVLNNITYSMLYYGDCFLELRRGKGNKKKKQLDIVKDDTSIPASDITELHVLETTEMRIVYDEHGDVKAYVQRPFNTSGLSFAKVQQKEREMGIWFKPEDVIHYTMKKVGSSVYSQTPLESVARQWSTKLRANTYLLQAFTNLPPEIYIHLKGANKNQRDEFASLIQRRKQKAGQIPVTYGPGDSGIQLETSEFSPGDNVMKVINYLRTEVLLITRVPPTWLGLKGEGGGANRGDAESMLFSFEVKVGSIHQKIQFTNNQELMPALKFDTIEFNFNPVSSRKEKEVVENAAVFHSMNIEPEAIVKYLSRHGITDINVDDFKEPEPMMDGMGGMGGGGGFGNQTASNKLSPSRKGMNKNTDSMKSNLNSGGVSKAGAAKSKEKAIKQR